MPLPLIPLIGAGASLGGSIFNTLSQSKANRQQLAWNKEQFEKSRQYALADWEMQNQYNSPAEQMKRLKAAGLNPNLVYGNGATTTAGPVKSTESQAYRPTAPQVETSGITNSLLSMYDIQLKQAQTDNVKAAVEIAKQELLNKITEGRTKEFDLGVKQELLPITLEGAATRVEKDKANIQYTLDANERAAAMNSMNLMTGIEKILTMRLDRAKTQDERREINQRIINMQSDNELKRLDINLRNMGINPNDPTWMRVIGQYVQSGKIGEKVKDFMNKVEKTHKKGVKGGLDAIGGYSGQIP